MANPMRALILLAHWLDRISPKLTAQEIERGRELIGQLTLDADDPISEAYKKQIRDRYQNKN